MKELLNENSTGQLRRLVAAIGEIFKARGEHFQNPSFREELAAMEASRDHYRADRNQAVEETKRAEADLARVEAANKALLSPRMDCGCVGWDATQRFLDSMLKTVSEGRDRAGATVRARDRAIERLRGLIKRSGMVTPDCPDCRMMWDNCQCPEPKEAKS